MPKLRGPLFSLGASGTLGKELTYVTNQTSSVVRMPQRKKINPSTLQTLHRNKIAQIPAAWRTLTTLEKASWAAAAAPFGLSGYSHFWRRYTLQNITPPAMPTP